MCVLWFHRAPMKIVAQREGWISGLWAGASLRLRAAHNVSLPLLVNGRIIFPSLPLYFVDSFKTDISLLVLPPDWRSRGRAWAAKMVCIPLHPSQLLTLTTYCFQNDGWRELLLRMSAVILTSQKGRVGHNKKWGMDDYRSRIHFGCFRQFLKT